MAAILKGTSYLGFPYISQPSPIDIACSIPLLGTIPAVMRTYSIAERLVRVEENPKESKYVNKLIPELRRNAVSTLTRGIFTVVLAIAKVALGIFSNAGPLFLDIGLFDAGLFIVSCILNHRMHRIQSAIPFGANREFRRAR